MKLVSRPMKALLTGVVVVGSLASTAALAQGTPPIVCPGYEKSSTNIPGERVGKKIQKAFELYSEDMVQEALAELYDIETRQEFDRAYTDRFIGNLLAGQDGKAKEALEYMKKSAAPGVLNDTEQASSLRLVADLSLQEEQYAQAVDYYNRWIDFTCKQDPDVYTRMAQAYYELKQLDKIIEPADKAIALYEEPNENPYVLKLTSFYERKMYPQTVEMAETLVQLFPEKKSWWVQLGFFYMLVEDYPSALSTFEIAYNKGYLEKVSELKALSQLYATQGIPYNSAVIQEKYLKSGLFKSDVPTLTSLANSWQQARNYEKAAQYYGQAAAISNDPDHYRRQGTLYLNAEMYSEALVALGKALEAGTDDKGQVHMAMMEANFYKGDFRKAYTHMQEAKKDNQTRRNARSWEAYIVEKAKNRGISLG